MTEQRNRHDRFDSHFGEWGANQAVLETSIGGIPAGTTLQDALELIIARVDLLDSGLWGRFSLNAVFRKTASKTFKLDAQFTLARIGHLTLDAWMIRHVFAGLTLDAIARKTQSNSFVLDAWFAHTTTATFTLNGWITGFHLQAIIRRTQAGSFLLDAVIRPASTFTGVPGDDTAMYGNFVLGEPG